MHHYAEILHKTPQTSQNRQVFFHFDRGDTIIQTVFSDSDLCVVRLNDSRFR